MIINRSSAFLTIRSKFSALYDVAVSCLRLKTLIDCIPQPCWMYTTCFSNLRCCGWSYGCTFIAVIHVQVGVDFRGNGVWPSLYYVAVSWLRLQTPIDCIPHLYWMNTKCFSTLRCCGWAYGCRFPGIPDWRRQTVILRNHQ